MASLTIRNLDDRLKQRLRVRAAEHGQSMEEEVRAILRSVLESDAPAKLDLADAIRARIGPLGGIDLETPAREPLREPPCFD